MNLVDLFEKDPLRSSSLEYADSFILGRFFIESWLSLKLS